MALFESRDAGDGTHYVIEATSGHLAHTDTGDGQRAAVGLTEAAAEQVASDLNGEATR